MNYKFNIGDIVSHLGIGEATIIEIDYEDPLLPYHIITKNSVTYWAAECMLKLVENQKYVLADIESLM